jgi:hypothetical protein
MTEEKQKIVIVIGAGASADFTMTEKKNLNEKHGDIKYEIWKNTQYHVDKNSNKNSRYFLSENNHKNYSFPSGEALIKLISNENKIAKIFLKEIIRDIGDSFIEKITLENEYKENILNQQYDDVEQLWVIEKTTNFDSQNYGLQQIVNNFDSTKPKSKIPELYSEERKKKFREILKINDGDKLNISFLDLIIKKFNSNSRYLQISSLVNDYQPFSIDELLDSIKTEKIDVLEPLKIKKEDLKAILKSDEQDQKKLEEQFRNELIDAGKTLIALFLLRSEKRELFDNQNPKNDSKIWYRHIRNLIINSGKNAKEIKEQIQNLTIISFNYDRSLDYYLRTKLKKDQYDEIKKKIFYPYGKLAEEDWDTSDYGSFERDGFNPYNEDELEKIKKLGQGLRVIGELDQENKNSGNINLEKAYNFLLALNESHKIYFLGFAFHQANCDLLQLKILKNKEIYWTNYENSVATNKQVENIFAASRYKLNHSVKKGVYDALMHDFKLEF